MPISATVFDQVVKQMIIQCAPDRVLDIGPGQGKYGRMLREVMNETDRPIHTVAVEIEQERVIERFALHEIYDEVINEDAARLAKRYPEMTGDLVIIGDVIEHLTKSEGIDLVEYLQYRFRHILLIIPMDWISHSFEDYAHEAHISIWRSQDIHYFEGGYAIERRIETENRFVLGSVNGITVPEAEHFVLRDKVATDEPQYFDANIEFGYLNRRDIEPD